MYVRVYYESLKSLLLIQISATILQLNPELFLLLFVFYSLSSENNVHGSITSVHMWSYILILTFKLFLGYDLKKK